MKRIGKLRSLFFFVTLAGLNAVCQTQQNATCQAQDYANVGAEIADTAAKIQLQLAGSGGLKQDVIRSIVDGYTVKRMQLAATSCSPSTPTTSSTGAQTTASNTSTASASAQVSAAKPDLAMVAAQPGATAKQKQATLTTVPSKCPSEPVFPTLTAAPMLDPIETGATAVTGAVKNATTGRVQVCMGGEALGQPVNINIKDGKFTVPIDGTKLTNGDVIVAQYINSGTDGGADQFGPTSDVNTVLVGDCSTAAPLSGSAPILKLKTVNGKVTYSGTTASDASGSVRICVNHVPNLNANTAPITNGKFDGGSNAFTVQPGDKVVAQVVSKDSPPKYSPLSTEVPIGLQVGTASDINKPFSVLIGGVEYAGYSSQAQTTDGFLNIFYRGPQTHPECGDHCWWKNGWSGWGRVRLTSAPSPTTNGIGSYISNPTGLTSYSYQNVGQALDYLFGPQWRIPHTEHIYIIGGFGATTPLSTQDAPVTFVAPNPGTQECSTLVNRFSVKNGYNPGLSLNTAPNAATCLAGGYTNIAFTNQDRSSFLMKYGAGVRASYQLFPKAWSSVDMTLGQDAAVSGGYMHGVVFKTDAILPIPTGSTSWLYLFGSAYIRLQSNQNLSPLILQTPPSPITVPSPNVFVLPLRQPNRDYFRLGVGLNINQLWCKAFGSNCGSSSPDASPTTPSSATDTSTPAKQGTAPGTGGTPSPAAPPTVPAKKA